MENNPDKYTEISFQEFKVRKYGSEGSKLNQDFNIDARVFRIGQKLKNIRNNLNMTQEELANRIGTKKSSISKIENGSDMNLSTLLRICEQGLEISIQIVFDTIVE